MCRVRAESTILTHKARGEALSHPQPSQPRVSQDCPRAARYHSRIVIRFLTFDSCLSAIDQPTTPAYVVTIDRDRLCQFRSQYTPSASISHEHRLQCLSLVQINAT